MVAAALVAAFSICVLSACDEPEWFHRILHSEPVETVAQEMLPHAVVDPADVPHFMDESLALPGEGDVTEEFLAMERQVVINVHSFEDAAAIITDLPSGTSELATFGTFYITDERLASIQRELELIDNGRFDMGFLLIDLETGAGLQYRIDEVFFSASSIKAINLCAILYYHPEAFSQFRVHFQRALQSSNNESYELIFNSFSDNIPNLWRARVGMGTQKWGRMFTGLTCRDMARLWCVTWDYLSQDTDITRDLHVWLGNSRHSCLAKVLGSRDGYQVTAKPGWNPDPTEADTSSVEGGYVVSPDGTYLLVMMSDRASYPDDLFEDLVTLLDEAYQEYAPRKERI